ncbi:hypothetical protein PHYBOEH_003423 [Phytophthora boehmeriae]|uniref:Uncharacterized protein n=1 Tax=Phytophthora boehmeriae TaxID=109152 RepID=A0A8T1WUS4_9STRA|nr:hypothetical protein PHYBOEH_003423 [Phytophthora boehmeriae]
MQSIDTSLEALESKPATKPGSARGRKTTPRSRGKKKEEKRTPTRRRASPRHRERHTVKEQEPKKETEEEQLTVEETQETEVETKVETQEEEVTEGLPPSQDQELRRTFLQRIYRQLQSTHPNQDDAVIRQIATNTEMEICQKSTSRDDYLAALDQEIHKLMQFEMAQAKTPTLRNETQDFEDVSRNNQVQNAVSTEMHREHAQAQITQSRHYEPIDE